MDAKAEFDNILKELNFKQRCFKLAELGKKLKSDKAPVEELNAKLRGLAGESPSTFVELNLIVVAQAAHVTGYPIHILDHSSQCVRRAAVSCNLLTKAQAREQFLSSSSSRQIKLWLLRQEVLPCDAEVLEQAQRMFGSQGLRRVLSQAEDPALCKKHLLDGTVKSLPNMRAMAMKFPEEMLELAQHNNMTNISWDWMNKICLKMPEKVFQTIVTDNKRVLPHWFSEPAGAKALSWAWRKHPDLLVQLCSRLQLDGDIEQLISVLSKTKTTAANLTPKKKVELMTKIFGALGHEHKTTQMAKKFVECLPKVKPTRPHESQFVVDGFWKIVGDMGSSARKETLQASNFDLVRYFLKRLPVPRAVDNFMKLLSETDVEADHSLFIFVLDQICNSDEDRKGEHDESMQRVFLKYLAYSDKEDKILDLFQRLLKSCSTLDVIQTAFDALTQRLSGTTQHGLLLSVVHRMKELQALSTSKTIKKLEHSGVRKPDCQLTLPLHWLHFVQLPKTGVSPYISYLHASLSTGLGQEELLGTVVGFYGRAFFWDSLEEVMTSLGRDQAKNRSTLISQQQPDASFLSQISKESLVAARNAMNRQTEGNNSSVSVPPSVADAAKKAYFERVASMKNDTYARCAVKRENGYIALMDLVKGQTNPEIFEDILPFLSQRLGSDQEDVRIRSFTHFLDKNILPIDQWERNFEHLQALYKAGTKNVLGRENRQSGDCTLMTSFAKKALQQCLYNWKVGENANMATFWAESLKVLLQPIGGASGTFKSAFQEAAKQREAEGQPIAKEAAKFTLEWSREAEATIYDKLSTFLDFLDEMLERCNLMDGCETWSNRRYRRKQAWNAWPFVQELWESLLLRAQAERNEDAMKYVVAGILKKLVYLLCDETHKNESETEWVIWLAPIEGEAYGKALQDAFALIEEMEYPKSMAARALTQRIENLIILKRSVETPIHYASIREGRLEELVKPGPVWSPPMPYFSVTLDGVDRELQLLERLFKDRQPEKEGDWEQHRDVTWSISWLGRILTGSKVPELLEMAIADLSPEFEGRGRIVKRDHSNIRQALSDENFVERNDRYSYGQTDPLTPLLEAWLTPKSTSRAELPAVAEKIELLMKRDDSHLLLFFGHNFAKFLCKHRQDYFHQCLTQLTAPGEGSPEFYHFEDQMRLARLATYSPGWSKRIEQQSMLKQVVTSTLQWHQETQALFLKKALVSTQSLDLVLLPRLEYVDGTERANEWLEQHPKEQTAAIAVDKGFVMVPPPRGAGQGIAGDVERRFLELGKAEIKDQVKSNELEQILSALGFADDALQALRVLGRFAGQVKKAKDAVLRAILNLSPAQTRTVVKEVLFGPKAGVSMGVAGVRTIADLRLPHPLELYQVAWRDGKCHRDVAAEILSRLATTPLQDSQPEELKMFFDFFNLQERADDWKPVGELLFSALEQAKHCVLPFLPAMLPEIGLKSGWPSGARNCLFQCKEFPDEVIIGATTMAQHYRLARRAQRIRLSTDTKKDGEIFVKITHFWKPLERQLQIGSAGMQQCSMPLAKQYIKELQLHCDSGGDLSAESVAEEWLKFLALSDAGPNGEKAWEEVAEIEKWLKSRGSTTTAYLTSFAELLTQAVCQNEQALARSGPESEAVVNRTISYFERMLSVHLPEVPSQNDRDREEATSKVLTTWLQFLVTLKGSKKAFSALFSHCPKKLAPGFAQQVVEAVLVESEPDLVGIGWCALEWLQTFEDEENFNKVLGIGQLLVASSARGAPSLEATIAQLSKSTATKKLSEPQQLDFADRVLASGDLRAPRGREVVNFVSKLAPAKAAAMWPKVFVMKESADDNTPNQFKDAKDVVSLIELCSKSGIEFPDLSASIVPLNAISKLAKSDLPSARVLAVEVMQERSLGKEGETSELLAELKEDSCSMVRLAASVFAA